MRIERKVIKASRPQFSLEINGYPVSAEKVSFEIQREIYDLGERRINPIMTDLIANIALSEDGVEALSALLPKQKVVITTNPQLMEHIKDALPKGSIIYVLNKKCKITRRDFKRGKIYMEEMK